MQTPVLVETCPCDQFSTPQEWSIPLPDSVHSVRACIWSRPTDLSNPLPPTRADQLKRQRPPDLRERERESKTMHMPRLAFLARSFKGSNPPFKTLICLPKAFSSSPSSQTFTSQPPPPPPPPPQTLADLRFRLAAESPSLADFIRLRENDEYSVEVGTKKKPLPKPKWMKESIPGGSKYTKIKQRLRELNLHTVCEEAKCPNLGECWSGGETGTATATIMILGDTCTRGCRPVCFF